MLMVKLTAQERAAALHSLEGTLEPWDKEWRKISPALRLTRRSLENGEVEQSAAAPLGKLLEFLEWNHAHIKALESQLIALSKASEQDSRTVSSLVNNLLEDTKKLLMLPFATLFRLFPKMVRDLAHDQNKNVQLVLQGSEIEIDKRILEGMKDPLIHLLRNSVDHGIETPQQREEQGKQKQATLTIAVSRLGSSEVQILFSDDGAGLNVAKIKSAAIKQGLISAEAVEKMADAQVVPLIFQSGVSTSSIITSISGRGLGMAIVREQVEKLGGRLSVETKSGIGTEFRIILPLAFSRVQRHFSARSGADFRNSHRRCRARGAHSAR